MIDAMPAVSADPIVADGATAYSVTMTVSDGDGFNDLRAARVLFDYTESGGDASKGRGYVSWGLVDGDITQYGGTWVIADAAGGGRWGYRTDAWGGTTYIMPSGCTMTPAGSATGGAGSRTVTWTFTAKSAWAGNPLMNDADAWAADDAVNSGWLDNPSGFDVVGSPCATWAATPSAPVVQHPTATTLDVAIHPGDAGSDLFAIRIEPAVGGKAFVQADGSPGFAAVWRTKSAWGTTTVTGLMWETSYTFSARAARAVAGVCPSPFGPGAVGTTAAHVPVIPYEGGTPFSTGVRGQCPFRSVSTEGAGVLWDLTLGSGARGLAGGLDADTYDWRDVNSGANWGLSGGHFTTLEFLEFARDHEGEPLLTANMFGGGYQDAVDGTFVCQTDNPEELAADWVRYTNVIAQNFREGDEGSLTGEDLRVYESIADWLGRAKLLAPGAAAVPSVRYWEIGNEPEVGAIGTFFRDHHLDANAYRDRYKLMAPAMLAVDPSIKIGPCLIDPANPNGSGQWLAALAADATIPIDFVGYHPYYSNIKVAWGNPAGMTDALRAYKSFLLARSAGIRTIMAQHGRTGYELMATEWNPMNWDAPSVQQRSVAQGLGVAEGAFTFAEDGVLAAHFWEQPQNKLAAKDVFAGLRDHMGDVLVASHETMGPASDDITWRVYVTKHMGDDGTLMIWGLNFDDDAPVEIELALAPSRVTSAVSRRYGQPGDDASGGDTSLMDSAGIVWEETAGADVDSRGFAFVMEDAEVTLLILEITPVPAVDFDRDGDVDQSDYGWFQRCVSGTGVAQLDPSCRDARVDGDADVDDIDLNLFIGCMSGAGIAADPQCAG